MPASCQSINSMFKLPVEPQQQDSPKVKLEESSECQGS